MKKTFQPLFKKTATGAAQIWEIWVTSRKDGAGLIHLRFGQVDGKMQESVEAITTGKNLGRNNATTAYQQAVAEAQSRWDVKKDRKGYGLTLDESAAVRSVSPMLAKVFTDHAKKVDWGTAFTQPKLDGFRVLAHFDSNGAVKLSSRENQPLDALTHIKKALQSAAKEWLKKPNVILDGEAYCHGMSLNQISSACKKKSDLTKKIQYHIYDHVEADAVFEVRCEFVNTFLRNANSDHLVLVETVKVRSESDLMQCQKEFIEQGYEGAMLRHSRAGYEAGKRSVSLLKVKTFQDEEFVVVDYKLGRGKFREVPIFTCETKAGDMFEVVAPGSMDEKRAFGDAPQKYIGKKLTVKFQYMTKTDEPVPFLPVAKAFR